MPDRCGNEDVWPGRTNRPVTATGRDNATTCRVVGEKLADSYWFHIDLSRLDGGVRFYAGAIVAKPG